MVPSAVARAPLACSVSLTGQGVVAAGSCSRASGPVSPTTENGAPFAVACASRCIGAVGPSLVAVRLRTPIVVTLPVRSSRRASVPSFTCTARTLICTGSEGWLAAGCEGVAAGACVSGVNCQLFRPLASVSSRMSGCTSARRSICTDLCSNGSSASWRSSSCSVAMFGREKPGGLDSVTSCSAIVGRSDHLSPIAPLMARSRPVACFTAVAMRGLRLFGSKLAIAITAPPTTITTSAATAISATRRPRPRRFWGGVRISSGAILVSVLV